MMLWNRCLLIAILLLASPASSKDAKELMIAAAASLQGALDQIRSELKNDLPSAGLTISYGGSGALRQQIEQGAPIDVFLSAAEKPVADLAKGGFLKGEARPWLGNTLVLIAPKGSKLKALKDLASGRGKRLALGEPRTVPAGEYAAQVLDSQKLKVKVSSQFIYAKDVRQVLTYIKRGEADAGFVYASDLYKVDDVTLVERMPEDSHRPIRYVGAVIKNSPSPEAAKAFLDLLSSEKAMKIWEKYGFRALDAKETHAGR